MKQMFPLTCLTLALLWLCQLTRAQDLSPLGLATSEATITPEQSVELETAVNALPVSEVPGYLGVWIEACKTGTPVKALNAAMGVLLVAIRTDGRALVSPRYPEILDFLNNPYPDVQLQGLRIIARNGGFAREASAKALQTYVAKGSRAPREEWIAGEDQVRSLAVQSLVRLAPAEKGTRDAIHALLSRNLSTDDRLAVLMTLGLENPADPESINILIKALDDQSPALRGTAINSLDAMDRNGNPVREKVEPKINQMSASDPDPQTRALAAQTLEHLRGVRTPVLPTFTH